MLTKTRSKGSDHAAHPLAHIGVLTGHPLPDGYDNPASRYYVPPELRPYWPSEDTQAAQWRRHFEDLGSQPKAEPTRLPSLIHDTAEWCVERDLAAKYPEGRPPRLYRTSDLIKDRARRLTDQDKADYLHQLNLAAARTELASAQDKARRQDERTARQTCAVCGQSDRSTSLRRLDPQSGEWEPFSNSQSTKMCTPCARVLNALELDRARQDTLNGKTRAAVAVEFLAQRPTA